MHRKPPLKKLVIELRYKPDLGFYGIMDSVGLALKEDFPYWERSPLTVEVRNQEHHRRIFLAQDRCFYEADAPDPDTEFDWVGTRLNKICKMLGVETLVRVGIRQWFVADLNKTFALMVDDLAQRFLIRNEQLTAILPDKTHDMGYTMIYKTKDEWKYNLRFGPMERNQWLQTVYSEPSLFEQKEDGSNTLLEFWQAIPEQFLYVDIDSFREDQPTQKLDEFLTKVRRKTHELVEKLIDFCKG
jgi:hypothetical protein